MPHCVSDRAGGEQNDPGPWILAADGGQREWRRRAPPRTSDEPDGGPEPRGQLEGLDHRATLTDDRDTGVRVQRLRHRRRRCALATTTVVRRPIVPSVATQTSRVTS